jgi:hypothetical protein
LPIRHGKCHFPEALEKTQKIAVTDEKRLPLDNFLRLFRRETRIRFVTVEATQDTVLWRIDKKRGGNKFPLSEEETLHKGIRRRRYMRRMPSRGTRGNFHHEGHKGREGKL